MFDYLKLKLMGRTKKNDFHKDQIRGTLKEIMKTRGLRTISLANYNNWKHGVESPWLHSLKIDIQDGYIYFYGYKENGKTNRAGKRLDGLTLEEYDDAYRQVTEIISNEGAMPQNVKRNVLVLMSR